MFAWTCCLHPQGLKPSLVMHPQCLAFSQNLDDGGSSFLRNADNHLPEYAVSYSRREYYSIQWIFGIPQHPVILIFHLQTNIHDLQKRGEHTQRTVGLQIERHRPIFHTFSFVASISTDKCERFGEPYYLLNSDSILPLFPGAVPVLWILKRSVPVSRPIRFGTRNVPGFPKLLKLHFW
jgi:hypothetical protein